MRSNFCSAIGAVGAARQRFANHLLHARRAGGTDHHLAAVLLAQPQRLLERIGVGLVHFIADILIANPGLGVVEAWLPLARGNLFDADRNFQGVRHPFKICVLMMPTFTFATYADFARVSDTLTLVLLEQQRPVRTAKP